MKPQTQNQKWNEALQFYLDDLQRVDEEKRAYAHQREIYNEYLWIRDSMIEHLHTLWRPVS